MMKKKLFLKSVVIQVATLAVVMGIFGILGANASMNMERQGLSSGFDFLDSTAGFNIILHFIDYSEQSTYGRAFVVSLINTIVVSIMGIVLATMLGFLIGMARLSQNWLVSRLAGSYVELLRNMPLLLQIFIWYFAVLRTLPPPRESLSFFDLIFLNIRGLYLPKPMLSSGLGSMVVAVVLAFLAFWLVGLWYRRRKVRLGKRNRYWFLLASVPGFILILSVWFRGESYTWDIPELRGFNFHGGAVLIPEFVALLLALSTYTAAFIAEIIRAGLLSVAPGQREAAAALGLSWWQSMRFVIIPQALRLIIPPLTSQYLNLTKNSSLAAAIAYPDLVLVFAGTVLNQTGRAVEVILMTMAVYLMLSLIISVIMNRYNRSIALKER